MFELKTSYLVVTNVALHVHEVHLGGLVWLLVGKALVLLCLECV